MYLTLNNHFKYNDILNIKYGRCNREPFDFRTECVETAKIIGKTDLPINIFFSGGIDSEVVVNAFIEADVPFTCIICDNGYNHHDILYAIKFCLANDIIFKFINMDVKEFWKDHLYKRSMETKCISPQFPVIMWMVEQVKGFNILGSGECFLNKEPDDNWVMFEREKVATLYKHYEIHNIQGAPGFFQYTPELMLSFLENPIVRDAVEFGEYDNSYPFKPRVYHDLWPDMEPRKKHTGFEKLKSLDKKYRKILNTLYPNSDRIFKTEYNKLINLLSPIYLFKCSKDYIFQYHDLYEKEGMSLKHSPYEYKTIKNNYYVAIINQEVAGFTSIDFFEDYKGCYVHGAYTMEKFRGQGVNRALWNFKMKDLEPTPEIVIHAINPHWLPDAKFQKEMLERKGLVHTSDRPDGAPVLTCKFKDLKNG